MFITIVKYLLCSREITFAQEVAHQATEYTSQPNKKKSAQLEQF
jgi:hypothetical protein